MTIYLPSSSRVGTPNRSSWSSVTGVVAPFSVWADIGASAGGGGGILAINA